MVFRHPEFEFDDEHFCQELRSHDEYSTRLLHNVQSDRYPHNPLRRNRHWLRYDEADFACLSGEARSLNAEKTV